ncbi:ribosomal 40S subunit protein S3 [Pichia kluyveri]|uniref:Small ribosomal subunit protein uS3 n=1 Tax=Pichia kluyveri TaxID=36015 RepID=A0AAV5R9J8_PICKL|nr:ribosomal 40S subunit protein S3 [Pichia kluyveri]
MVNVAINKKRKLVADGVFYAELNEFFTRELAEEGYAGCEVKITPTKTDVIIKATRTNDVLGEKGRRIRELTMLIQKRFGLAPQSIALYAERVQNRGLSASTQCESLKFKLLNGLAVRRAAYGVIRNVMESGAKGIEVVISGKSKGARARAIKFGQGFMIHSGQPVNDFIEVATRHVLLRQGVLGLKVKIMKDPAQNKNGPKSLPDYVKVLEPKEDKRIEEPVVVILKQQAKVESTEAAEQVEA